MNFDRITSDDLSTLRIDNKKISQYSVKCIDNDKIIAYIILQDIPFLMDSLFQNIQGPIVYMERTKRISFL